MVRWDRVYRPLVLPLSAGVCLKLMQNLLASTERGHVCVVLTNSGNRLQLITWSLIVQSQERSGLLHWNSFRSENSKTATVAEDTMHYHSASDVPDHGFNRWKLQLLLVLKHLCNVAG